MWPWEYLCLTPEAVDECQKLGLAIKKSSVRMVGNRKSASENDIRKVQEVIWIRQKWGVSVRTNMGSTNLEPMTSSGEADPASL